jgi:PAS domain S-box-containing protein
LKKDELGQAKEKMRDYLNKLKGIEVHYTRKEQVLFPYLEKHGFFGPSKVMWGKDNDIRDLLKKSLSYIETIEEKKEMDRFSKDFLAPLLEEVEGMIFKEENILFPTTLEKLSVDEWANVLKESDEAGYVFIEKPKETEDLIRELKTAVIEEPAIKEGNIISFPTGEFALKELMGMLNTLPVDITFVDKEDKVKYFSDSKERIFTRTKSIIGRKVQNCHPPQSLDVVEKILNDFKENRKDFHDFWINLMGKLIHIRYFAVRDHEGKYLGTVEVTQDIKPIQELKGEKRLLDEKD